MHLSLISPWQFPSRGATLRWPLSHARGAPWLWEVMQ